MRTVTYRGETIELARTYASYVEFRDDPSNLPPTEISHVAGLIKAAPIPKSFSTADDALAALLKIKFPGHGLWILSQQGGLMLYGIEIPKTGEIRWVVTLASTQGVLVADDFVWSVSNGNLNRVELVFSDLGYFDARGSVLRQKGMTEPNPTFQRTASPPLN